MKYFLTVLNDSTFPGLVIWSKTMHIKKTWSRTPHCVCGDVPHSSWQTTHVRKEHCRHVLWQTIYQTLNRKFYHTSNSCKCMGVNGLGKPYSCMQFLKSCVFLLQVTQESVSVLQVYKSQENPYQVLQVTGTASERAMKSKVCTINHYHHSTKLNRKKYHLFVAVGTVTCAVHS